ncbi:hypothetical protein BJ322DRAFT_1113707 [Thelephora terrestris]|uniref:Uncharacterized protein n=1 Tax=Thelephora terrestris TaxID=56493 RepID=A0A9P6H6T7_9AGAM|nr:hypothetical protein BJ322DRAFT_1113707 [Thelephora terrestris]
MDYAGDWTPSKGPNGIAPFAELDQLGEDCLFPPEKDEWSKPEIRQLIAGSPDCVNLVWQSVLAVWRLKTLEGRLEEEKELRGPWADHLSAWLSRHRDVCRAFHIEPLRLVTDFAEAAHKVGHIEAEMVPDFGNSTGTAAGTTAGTTSHRAPTPAPSARISTEPAPMATEPAEDVEMVGEEIAPAPARVDKGKGRVRERFEVVVPPRAKPTPKTRAQAVEPSVGTKRSRKSRRNQRVESDESEKEEPALLDLSGETVVEGDPLDVERIPLARGATCGLCSRKKKSQRRCAPLWYPGQDQKVKCAPCGVGRKACSFGLKSFGIGKWPNIEPSEAGKALRRKDAEKHRSKSAMATELGTVEVGRMRLRDVAPSMSTRSRSGAAGASFQAPVQVSGGVRPPDVATVFFADLAPLGDAAGGSGQSRFDLQLRRTELRSILRRERADANEIVARVEDRRLVGKEILAALNEAIIADGGEGVYEDSDLEYVTDVPPGDSDFELSDAGEGSGAGDSAGGEGGEEEGGGDEGVVSE